MNRPGRTDFPFLPVGVIGFATVLFPPFADRSYDLWVAGAGALGTFAGNRDDAGSEGPPGGWGLAVAGFRRGGVGAGRQRRRELGSDTAHPAADAVDRVVRLPAAQLELAAVAAGAVFVMPLILAGAPRSDPRDWRTAVIWVLVIVVVCPTLQAACTGCARRCGRRS